ncbi:hypothetical protein ACJMK2_029059 [Sinanodonta woodiana]|uniref:TLDc domain-containing protein n=1 Tax=Sinanodonta woodiana TaxID=1069815 RepID=A0ABD3XD18_SINWO
MFGLINGMTLYYKIMDSKLDRQDRQQLEQWIGGGPKTFTLLYSIQKNGCSSTEFHKICDNQGPTVTVLFNTSKSVFGGYTSISWRSCGNYASDDKAFLFQLHYNGNRQCQKLLVTKATHAICDTVNRGPTFGGGHDLCTFNNSIQKISSTNTFLLDGYCKVGNSFSNLGLTIDQFMNNNLNVFDLQVYKVTDGKDSYLDLEVQWRKSPALTNALFKELKEQIENYKPVPSLSLSQVRVLLLGPVGAGKSSFFNTINSIFRGRISHQGCSGSSDHSLTNVYRQYQVRSGTTGEPLSFRLCDTRGLEEGQGLDVLEVNYLLEGHVPDFYQFNPSASITPEVQGFNKNPALKDKIHCVAFVIDGSTIDFIAKPIMEKFKSMQTRMNQRGIPQTIILTKVDKLSKVVIANISDVFRSEEVKEAVEKVSQMFGVPRGNVLPVKNYENEVRLDDQISALALLALQQILGFADDFLYNYLDKLECENVQKLNIKE